MRKFLSVLLLQLILISSAFSQVKIIFDTDFGGDADDLGALAMLHNYVTQDKCELLAVMCWSQEVSSVPAIDAVNRYYGHPDIPVAVREGNSNVLEWNYGGAIIKHFEYEKTFETVPTTTALYRELLAAEKDASVVLVTVGPLANIQLLMESGPDKHSKLTGKELLHKKVKEVVIMGGKFPEGKGEWNFNGNMENVTKYVLDNISVPVTLSGFEVGVVIKTGAELNELDKNTPVYYGYEHFSRNASWMKDQYKGMVLDNSSFDQTAVLYAVEGGIGKYWERVEGGYCHVEPNGDNAWVNGEKTNQSYLRLTTDPEVVAKVISKLMFE